MKISTALRVALIALPLALVALITPAASAQTLTVGLTCPFFGGTCEATPQLPGFIYAFQSQGNAAITIPSPETSPAAFISCLKLLPTAGQVSVTVIAPDGQRGTVSVAACPGIRDDAGPFFPF